jgi:hypothetical protein
MMQTTAGCKCADASRLTAERDRLQDQLRKGEQIRRRDIDVLTADNDRLRAALEGVLADIADYERVNNLAPNPGKKYCWQSVEIAHRALEGK